MPQLHTVLKSIEEQGHADALGLRKTRNIAQQYLVKN